ncbi:MAG: TatD DNase family protein [Lentimonas sp.]|jgi:TatD DNase family protein
MPAPLFDAHNHLAHPALACSWEQVAADLDAVGVGMAVVNGVETADWPKILHLARSSPHILPAIGLHPWSVNAAPSDWQQQFTRAMDAGAKAIGEVGLDRWIQGYDIDRQMDAFCWQVAQARARNLPLSIHCLKAMGLLLETLSRIELPARGFHLHAYNGSAANIPQLVQRGAYFSFNSGQLKPRAKTVRQAIQAVPVDRLLIETDAPDMLPPPALREFELPAPDHQLNHPANLRRAYQAIAEIRGLDFQTLAAQVERNFKRFFLS